MRGIEENSMNSSTILRIKRQRSFCFQPAWTRAQKLVTFHLESNNRELEKATVRDYRIGKTGAQLAEAGLFKLKIGDVTQENQ